MDSYKFLLVCGFDTEKIDRGIEVVFAGGVADSGVFCGGKSW
jgi:hypothetical protein